MSQFLRICEQIDDTIEKHRAQITRLREILEVYSPPIVDEMLDEVIKKYEKAIQNLENLKPIIQLSLTESENEKVAVLEETAKKIAKDIKDVEQINGKLDQYKKNMKGTENNDSGITKEMWDKIKDENSELRERMNKLQKELDEIRRQG